MVPTDFYPNGDSSVSPHTSATLSGAGIKAAASTSGGMAANLADGTYGSIEIVAIRQNQTTPGLLELDVSIQSADGNGHVMHVTEGHKLVLQGPIVVGSGGDLLAISIDAGGPDIHGHMTGLA